MAFLKLPGVRVPHRKNTADMPAIRMPAPAEVCIPMSMHIGAPAKPVVKPGDTVKVGQLIAEAGGFVSSPIHSSVSGTVKKIEDVLTSSGSYVPAIFIASDGKSEIADGITPPVITDSDSFAAAVRNSGIVGLGGAGFPTSVKLAVKDLSKIEHVVVNGAECEPYITSDTRTMIDRTSDIVEGVALLEKWLGAKSIIFGVESNKKKAIDVLRAAFSGDDRVTVKSLPPIYPQGGEKVLIYNTVGRIVPEGKLPLDVGVVILNVTTLASIAAYVRTGMPLVEKCITVDGSAVKEPKNVIAPIGTRLKDVFEFAGGFRCEPKKVLYGGPMMGISVPDLEQPVLKMTNAIIAMDSAESEVPEEKPCIRCGSCINHCPLHLDPPAIGKAYKLGDTEALEKLKVNLCMECGVCSYSCPARRHIVQRNKLAKAELRRFQTERAERKKKEEENKNG